MLFSVAFVPRLETDTCWEKGDPRVLDQNSSLLSHSNGMGNQEIFCDIPKVHRDVISRPDSVQRDRKIAQWELEGLY